MMAAPQTDPRVWRDPFHWLAFGFGAGTVPLAPGTAGTAVAVPVYLLLSRASLPVYLLAVAAVCVFGVWLCGRTARELGVHDHPGIVWDEIAGYLITMVGAPTAPLWWVLGFILFRVFDIAKPWPIRWVDRRVGGGWGIMFDDMLAGAYGAGVLQLVGWLAGA
jgi:phosphatidylglycerophosphatase A